MCENCSVVEQIWQKEHEIDNLKKDSFHRGFMTRDLPNNVFPKRGQGVYAFRPYPMYGDADIHTKIAENVTAVEYAKLSSVNVNSPKEDIVEFVTILQRLLAQGVFDPLQIEPDKNVQYNGINPFNVGSTYQPTPPMYGGVQPLYGAPGLFPGLNLPPMPGSPLDVAGANLDAPSDITVSDTNETSDEEEKPE